MLGHPQRHRQPPAEELDRLLDLEAELDRLVGAAADPDHVRLPDRVVAGVHDVVPDLFDGPVDGDGCGEPGSWDEFPVRASGHRYRRSQSETWAGWTVSRDDAAQVGAERLEVDLVAQPGAERLQRARRVVAAAVEAAVDQPPGSAPAPAGTAPPPPASRRRPRGPTSPSGEAGEQHRARGRSRPASPSARA